MKKIFKTLITNILGWQVRRLQQAHGFTTVAVVGIYGKTSTKLAIAELLQSTHKVQYQVGNYNDHISVPMVIFGQELSALFNPLAWAKIFWANERYIRGLFPYDVVVLELGIDGPGQMQQFGNYLTVDLAVVTAIGPEHMEYFTDVDQVAAEELAVRQFSKHTLINTAFCESSYIPHEPTVTAYHAALPAARPIKAWNLVYGTKKHHIKQPVFATAQVHSLSSAYAVGLWIGLQAKDINDGLAGITAVAGRMQKLNGKNGSVLIDDTYNASPEAVIAALDTLYEQPAKSRLALLGNMNELGDFAAEHHRVVGEYCDPKKLELVVTLGPDANAYTAAAAEERGCSVYRARDAADAAAALLPHLSKDTVVLAKGSQNGVYAEEAVKLLLATSHDSDKLVRQSDKWLQKKGVSA